MSANNAKSRAGVGIAQPVEHGLPIDTRDLHRICILIDRKVRDLGKTVARKNTPEKLRDQCAGNILYYADLLDRLTPFNTYGAERSSVGQ